MITILVFWALGLTISTVAAAVALRFARAYALAAFTTLLAGYVLSANVLVPRLVTIDWGVTATVVASGSLIWPFTSQLSDMINEIYGRNRAIAAILLAYLLNLLFVTFVFLVGAAEPLWGADHELWWREYFYASGRIFLASSATFLLVGIADAYLFSWFKRGMAAFEAKAGGVGFAFSAAGRSALSDVSSMALDSILFAVFAFAGVLSRSELVALIGGSLALKCMLALADTPWFVLFRLMTRHVAREDVS